jgi:hypothetical protein
MSTPLDIRLLRTRQGLSVDEVARRLGIGADDVRTLERTPLRLWEVADATRYAGVLGFALELVAVGTNGDRHVLEVAP